MHSVALCPCIICLPDKRGTVQAQHNVAFEHTQCYPNVVLPSAPFSQQSLLDPPAEL